MKNYYYQLNIVSLKKEELENINGGGITWEWLGKVTGRVKNAIVGYYEAWMDMPAMPY